VKISHGYTEFFEIFSEVTKDTSCHIVIQFVMQRTMDQHTRFWYEMTSTKSSDRPRHEKKLHNAEI